MPVAPPPVRFKVPENYVRAGAVKVAKKWTFSGIPGWTTDADKQPKKFQEKGIVFLYVAERAILADQVGLGKTIQALGVTQLLADRGEPHRTIVVTLKAAQTQWYKETATFTDMEVAIARGNRYQRAATYASDRWDVLITTYPLLLRDWKEIRRLVDAGQVAMIVLDEGSTFRHHATQTKEKVQMVTYGVPRIYVLDATPIQTELADIHSLLQVLHMNIFGELPAFEMRYVRRMQVKIKRGDKFVRQSKIVGYKNMGEFRERIEPFILRRRATDPEVEVELPEIMVDDNWLELMPEQQRFYDLARRGVQLSLEEGRTKEGRAGFHTLQYACDSTWAFGQDPPFSSKIDKIVEWLRGDLSEEKVVVFSKYKKPIAHLMWALRRAGIRAATYTGDEDQVARDAAVQEFREGDLQVLVGTSALERGLNLQRSAHLIALNQIWNPQRMVQLAGRIRRIGSTHPHVFIHNLFIAGSFEERMLRLQRERAALPDWVFDEQSEMFEKLSDEELLDLIRE